LVEDRDDEPAANLLGAAGGRTRDFRWRMASDRAGAPAGFGWGGGMGIWVGQPRGWVRVKKFFLLNKCTMGGLLKKNVQWVATPKR
jgi:hypothetical protein